MNDLCADIGYKSINHVGEQLCGDHVDVVEQGENSTVIVLADGLGSGVKASILSTLTSKIISTMMAEGLSLEDCVATIAATLPVCSVRGVAYSTSATRRTTFIPKRRRSSAARRFTNRPSSCRKTTCSSP